jgi:hypothetical protein
METVLAQEMSPSVSSEQLTSSDLVKRIRKLRWIGREEEAERLQNSLCRIPRGDSVLAVACDTD